MYKRQVKIPAIPEGFKAMKQLCSEGIRVTATAVYTPMQAFLAGKCGADYAAPYINRIDNMGYNGVEIAQRIHTVFRNNGLKTEVLADVYKRQQQDDLKVCFSANVVGNECAVCDNGQFFFLSG